jgi:hypothetical protein
MTGQMKWILRSGAFLVFVFCLVSCSKDKFTTKPQLRLKKVGSNTVPRGGLISFVIEFTDKEGDLTDSIWIESRTTRCVQSNRVLTYAVPAFPTNANVKGEFEINFVNGQFLPGFVALPGPACGQPDTTTFFFWIRDKAQNISDTIRTNEPIIILN